MKILIISPKKSLYNDSTPGWIRIPQLSLAILKSLTPEKHDVVLVEEEFESIPADNDWDVVGISTMTSTATRAYELADRFRKNGTKVVLGGIHPSVMPDEAALHADAVVIGEAEGLWPEVLEDIENGSPRKLYRNWQPDISDSPLPTRTKRRSILGFPPYVMPVMFSRGCPNDCEFCCVHRVYGRRQRFIPVENVVNDIERTGARRLIFLDDNIGGRRSYALKLFKAIEPLKVKWLAQASMKFILDDELFDAGLKAGMGGLFLGLETVEPEAMSKMRKTISLEQNAEAIKRCRESGVAFHASLIFGLDEQTPHTFDFTLDFLLENRVPSITTNVLTPYPGTYLFDRLEKEGRILHKNWRYYDHCTVCYMPKNMEPEELSERYLDFRKKFYSFSSMAKRAWSQIKVKPLLFLGINLAFRKTQKMLVKRHEAYFKWLAEYRNQTADSKIFERVAP